MRFESGGFVSVVVRMTWLVPPGEFAASEGGALVAAGMLGSRLGEISFDAIALHVNDGRRLLERLGSDAHSREAIRDAIAQWWE